MTEPAAATSSAGRPSSTRSKARKRALDILFEAELRGTDTLETLAQRSEDADPPVRDYTRVLVEGVSEHGHDIDARISASLARGWALPRTPRVDRTALRIAVFEIDYLDVPDVVAVTEAVRLVSDLSTDDSPSFVHGVLGSVVASKALHAPAPDLDTATPSPATAGADVQESAAAPQARPSS